MKNNKRIHKKTLNNNVAPSSSIIFDKKIKNLRVHWGMLNCPASNFSFSIRQPQLFNFILFCAFLHPSSFFKRCKCTLNRSTLTYSLPNMKEANGMPKALEIYSIFMRCSFSGETSQENEHETSGRMAMSELLIREMKRIKHIRLVFGFAVSPMEVTLSI